MEQLINFETSKLAKEAGFDYGKCNRYYHNQIIKSSKILCEDLPNCYPAPSQSLLQKWLRDEHNIHVIAKAYNDEELNQILWEDVIIDFEDYWQEYSTYTFYHSYEECLEAGLQKALKIVISKNSQDGN